jgi:hypothetical protein
MAEAAGVALAVFPLVIKGLRFYVDLWHRKLGMRSLVRELKVENVLFQNTCTNVLAGIFPPSEVTKLMGGDGWDEDFVQHLQECWGKQNAEVFIEAVKEMTVTLEELRRKLGLESDMTVSRST